MIPSDAPKTREAIAELLSRGHWYTSLEIVGFLQIAYNRPMTESAATARARELRKEKFGGYTVKCRIRQGCTAGEYRILPAEQKAA